ncbi:hypothetical protein BC831DRAFT_491665 [Entophlyctis helioformis]|nr:hypothetical protein BC831DRAFT_491665 [Entophlyctis helioformis]
MAARILIIFDTTLRDGEQSPGVTLTVSEKLEIAKQLSRLGVDVCEAGFPIASDGDFEAVRRIAVEVGPLTAGRKTGTPMVICALARAVQTDIKRAFDAIRAAPRRRIHTFLATSDIHLQFKLKISREECISRAVAAVQYAKSLGCDDIEFSPEDAGRSDRKFLVQVLEAVIAAGATTVNIPDTVGYNTPEEYGSIIKYLVDNVKSSSEVVFSTHCHNDLGLATANTLAGIRNGARQVEVTINGIGERAGNTSLEEIVMAIHTHPTAFPVYHTIDTYQIYHASQLVTKKTGMVIQPNKAIVGANAFAHESGIHQDGVLKHKATYEIIQPEILGIPSKALVLGKHSGRNAFRTRIDDISKNTIYQDYLARDPLVYESLFVAFKKLADSKKNGVRDQDLFALLDDQLNLVSSGHETYKFGALQVLSGSGILSTATVTITDTTCAPLPMEKSPSETEILPSVSSGESVPSLVDSSQAHAQHAPAQAPPTGRVLTDAAIGHGPVHAIFSAINRLVGFKNVLASYEVKAITEGSDSLGKVIVRIQQGAKASATDALPSSASSDERPSKIPRIESDELETVHLEDTIQGQGVDADILVASAKAYINAVNKMLNAERRAIGKKPDQTEALPSRKVGV